MVNSILDAQKRKFKISLGVLLFCMFVIAI